MSRRWQEERLFVLGKQPEKTLFKACNRLIFYWPTLIRSAFALPPLFIVANRRAHSVEVVPFAAQGLHLDSARIDWLLPYQEEEKKLPPSENPESRWSRDKRISGLIINL